MIESGLHYRLHMSAQPRATPVAEQRREQKRQLTSDINRLRSPAGLLACGVPRKPLRVNGENRVSKNHATRMIVGRVLYEVSKIAPNPRSASCPAFVARCSIFLAETRKTIFSH